jgi:tRNA threonylcarbamoyladenosine biosynthesis protein TsaB
MIVLGIDTSGYANAVGVIDGGRVSVSRFYEAKTDSLEQIVDNIDSTLTSAGLTIDDVQGIGVGLGPGSWTGIRVGVTVGKILGFSMERPVAGIPTLEALAYAVRDESKLIYPVVNVGSGDAVYAALYRSENEDIMQNGDYYVGDFKGLVASIKEPCVIVGQETSSFTGAITQTSGIEIKVVDGQPDGAIIASLAERRLKRGDCDDVLSLTPLYLKESTAKAFVNKYKGSHGQGTG